MARILTSLFLMLNPVFAQEPITLRPSRFPAPERLVAVGDLHGDMTALLTVLTDRQLIDKNGKWIGGKTNLVFVGDMNDRGADTRYIFDYIIELEKQAAASGGMIHSVLGNHEVMITHGTFDYATKEEVDAFGGKQKMKQLLSGNSKYARWIRERQAMVVVGETLFVPGGVTRELLKFGVEGINTEINKWIRYHQGIDPKKPEDTYWIVEDGERRSPLWNRDIANGLTSKSDVRDFLETLGAKRLVIAHTVTENKEINIVKKYDEKVIMVDTGMSAAMGGKPSSLEIRGQTIDPRTVPRSTAVATLRQQLIFRFMQENAKPVHYSAPSGVKPAPQAPPN